MRHSNKHCSRGLPDESGGDGVRYDLVDSVVQVLTPQLGRYDVDVKVDTLYIYTAQTHTESESSIVYQLTTDVDSRDCGGGMCTNARVSDLQTLADPRSRGATGGYRKQWGHDPPQTPNVRQNFLLCKEHTNFQDKLVDFSGCDSAERLKGQTPWSSDQGLCPWGSAPGYRAMCPYPELWTKLRRNIRTAYRPNKVDSALTKSSVQNFRLPNLALRWGLGLGLW